MRNKKTALITGGTRGIGKGLIQYYSANGYKCITTYSRDIKSAEALEEWGSKNNAELEIHKIDLSDISETEKFIKQIIESNDIDLLINNAGNDLCKNIVDCSVAEWQYTSNLILNSPFIICKYIVPGMRKRGYGRIINIGAGSYNYLTGNPGFAPFGIMKGSLIIFTKELAAEEIKNGITVNLIGPGSTKDAGTNPEEKRIPVIKLPLGRRVLIEEIIRAVDFFVRPENSAVTGQVINVCGGYHV